jgi:ABC-2 type transport system permease protein
MKFKNLFIHWRAVLTVAEVTLKHQMNDSFILFAIVVQPLIIAILALFMLKDTATNAAMFVVVGSGLTGLWSSLLFISGNSINAERWQGTLESLVGMPTPFEVVVFGKNLANVVQSLLSMITAYLLASIFFGYSLSMDQPLFFVVSLILSIFAFVSFGLTIAPVFWNIRYISWLVSSSLCFCFPAGRRPYPIYCLPTGLRSLCMVQPQPMRQLSKPSSPGA